MRAIIFLLGAMGLASGADVKTDDTWAKVKELKSGTEIRVYKKGMAQPVLAKAGDATDDKLIIIVKNSQSAIDKKDIDRIEARLAGGKRTTMTSTSKSIDPTSQTTDGVRPENYPRPGTSSSAGMSIGSKPDFETIYQRRPGAK